MVYHENFLAKRYMLTFSTNLFLISKMHLVVVVPPNTGARYLGKNTRVFQVAGCQYKFLCTAVHSLLTDILLEHPTGASENTHLF